MGARGAALVLFMAAASPVTHEQRQGDLFHLQSDFTAAVPAPVVWDVLTDYAHLGRFVPSIAKSVVRTRSGSLTVVEQELTGRVWLFSRTLHVLLRIQAEPHRELRFADVSHRDFAAYSGAWTLTPGDAGTLVRYRLDAKVASGVPVSLLGQPLEASVDEMMKQLQAEMERRSPPAPGSPR